MTSCLKSSQDQDSAVRAGRGPFGAVRTPPAILIREPPKLSRNLGYASQPMERRDSNVLNTFLYASGELLTPQSQDWRVLSHSVGGTWNSKRRNWGRCATSKPAAKVLFDISIILIRETTENQPKSWTGKSWNRLASRRSSQTRLAATHTCVFTDEKEHNTDRNQFDSFMLSCWRKDSLILRSLTKSPGTRSRSLGRPWASRYP